MSFPLVAVDIGNARMKIGAFSAPTGDGLPEPARVLPLDGEQPDLDRLATWLDDLPAKLFSWYLASVNRPAATRLIDWLRKHRPDDQATLLSAADLPLEVRLERPDMVGIDRLIDAAAVNRVREPRRTAVIVDVGTAITVDLVATDGAFLGGAILPGLEISARALHEFTDLLPLVDFSDLSEPPPALGTATEEAMRSGLFWGAVGGIRELIDKLGRGQSALPQVFLTGGAGRSVAELLGPHAHFVPHLTMAGIALAAARLSNTSGVFTGGQL
jgi:type III pantothenate kinase